MKEAKKETNKAFIKNSVLFVNGQRFTLNDLKDKGLQTRADHRESQGRKLDVGSSTGLALDIAAEKIDVCADGASDVMTNTQVQLMQSVGVVDHGQGHSGGRSEIFCGSEGVVRDRVKSLDTTSRSLRSNKSTAKK